MTKLKEITERASKPWGIDKPATLYEDREYLLEEWEKTRKDYSRVLIERADLEDEVDRLNEGWKKANYEIYDLKMKLTEVEDDLCLSRETISQLEGQST